MILLYHLLPFPPMQVALLFSGLFVFFVFACAQPYNSTKANFIEGFVLLDLLILTSLFLDTAEQKQRAVRAIGYILLLAPFISMVLYIAAMLFGYAWLAILYLLLLLLLLLQRHFLLYRKKWCPLMIRSFLMKHQEKVSNWKQVHRFVSHETEFPDTSTELETFTPNVCKNRVDKEGVYLLMNSW